MVSTYKLSDWNENEIVSLEKNMTNLFDENETFVSTSCCMDTTKRARFQSALNSISNLQNCDLIKSAKN